VPPARFIAGQRRKHNQFNPAVTVHGTNWFKNDAAMKLPMNGPVMDRDFAIKTPIGDTITRSSDKNGTRSRLDYFMLMFPPAELTLITQLTSEALVKDRKKSTTKGEILKFFGVCILITRFEFSRRAALWSTTAPSKYIPAPCLGKTGMSRNRFDDIMRHIRFSRQPVVRPPGMSSETYRWKLVDDFVMHFNDHRAATFVPSSHICADESISRWYGLGGEWINLGLPMYIAIDRKPENGCEIQDSACGKSGVMLRIRLVKTAVEEEANSLHVEEDGTLHGTKVLIELVSPWAFSDRLICADSYFASVGAAETLKAMGLRFIGVVKTATRHFPLAYLSNLELENRGDRVGLVHYGPEGNPSLLAFMWMDRNRSYFIASGSSLEEGEEYIRNRWQQVDTAQNADAEMVELTVPQPKAAEECYSTCGSVDQHNWHRMDTLNIEKKIETKEWSRRVNMSILGMCMVDTWLALSQATASQCLQTDFYIALSEELIDNYDSGATTGARRLPAPGLLVSQEQVYLHILHQQRRKGRRKMVQ
jgi:hypothetical protein